MSTDTGTPLPPGWSRDASEARQLLAQALRDLGDATRDTADLAVNHATPKIRRAHQLLGGA